MYVCVCHRSLHKVNFFFFFPKLAHISSNAGQSLHFLLAGAEVPMLYVEASLQLMNLWKVPLSNWPPEPPTTTTANILRGPIIAPSRRPPPERGGARLALRRICGPGLRGERRPCRAGKWRCRRRCREDTPLLRGLLRRWEMGD